MPVCQFCLQTSEYCHHYRRIVGLEITVHSASTELYDTWRIHLRYSLSQG